MAGKGFLRYTTVLAGFGIVILMGTGLAWASDIATILKQTEAKKAWFERKVKDMAITQEARTSTPQGEMTMEIKMMIKGDKFRLEQKILPPRSAKSDQSPPAIESVAVFDGQNGVMVNPLIGRKKLTPQEARQMQTGAFWWAPLIKDAKVVGRERIRGRDCYKIKLIKKKGTPLTQLWLDTKTLVEVKAEAREPEGGPVEVRFSDFRKVALEMEVPYKTETYIKGRLASTTKILKIKVNQGLSDDRFDPARLKAPAN